MDGTGGCKPNNRWNWFLRLLEENNVASPLCHAIETAVPGRERAGLLPASSIPLPPAAPRMRPDYCHTCPLRQTEGTPPSAGPLPTAPNPAAYTPGKPRPDLQGASKPRCRPSSKAVTDRSTSHPTALSPTTKKDGSHPATSTAMSAIPRTLGDSCLSGRSVAYDWQQACAWSTAVASASSCVAITPVRPCSDNKWPTTCAPDASYTRGIYEQSKENQRLQKLPRYRGSLRVGQAVRTSSTWAARRTHSTLFYGN